ncbi:MAG: ABC transporter permease [Acidobacteria bacterium]|nr:ABC transporter permease [Acidobacteriota bacterium]
MSLLEALRIAFGSILGNKLRSFLTLLGVIFGVATVIVVVSIIEGFNAYVDDKIANIGTNAFSLQKYSIEDFASVEALNAARRRNKDVNIDDLEALQELAAGSRTIRDAAGKAASVADVKFGNETLQKIQLKANTPNLAEIENIETADGRYFSAADEEARRYVAFLGSEAAAKLFPNDPPIGKTIKVDGRTFQVIGVGKELGTAFGQTRDMYVAIPLRTFLSINGLRRNISISISSTTPEAYVEAADEVRTLMRTRRKLSPSEADNFGIVTPGAINKLRDQIFGTIQIAAIGVTSISLVVGGIVIMNIMLVSVTERTKEIGIRMSIGARRRDILKQFLAESVTLSLIGGAIGIAIAFLLSQLVATLTPIPTALPIGWVIAALTVSSGVGLVSGVYPAWTAAGLDPIEALRSE